MSGRRDLEVSVSAYDGAGPAGLSVFGVPGMPEVEPGADLAGLIAAHALPALRDGDVVVVTQKIVSKAEGRLVAFEGDSPEARRRLAESEAVRVLRRRGDLVVTETRHGFVCANSGVDLSNVAEGVAALLPLDPDRSARRIRDGLRARAQVEVGVVVSDTFGRPWRRGVTDVAIGSAGIRPVLDLRGTPDAL
ncbi:MAG: coenzyme F420-0:L-glutamate ligase, partial [Acidimicrobiales bacterium]